MIGRREAERGAGGESLKGRELGKLVELFLGKRHLNGETKRMRCFWEAVLGLPTGIGRSLGQEFQAGGALGDGQESYFGDAEQERVQMKMVILGQIYPMPKVGRWVRVWTWLKVWFIQACASFGFSVLGDWHAGCVNWLLKSTAFEIIIKMVVLDVMIHSHMQVILQCYKWVMTVFDCFPRIKLGMYINRSRLCLLFKKSLGWWV